MTAFFTNDFADVVDDAGNLILTLNAGRIVDGVGEERVDAIKVQDRANRATVGWVARGKLTPDPDVVPVAPALEILRFIETAQDAANAVNKAFADAVELSSTLLLIFAWSESGWQNAGTDLPVPAGPQPQTKFGPFGFLPDRWSGTIGNPRYAEILRGIDDFSRIDPYLQCYVAACLVNELQTALHAATGSAPSSTLIRIAFLVGAEEGSRFARLALGDQVDNLVDGTPALTAATIAAHGDLLSSGGTPRTRADVEATVEAQLKEAAKAAADKAAEFNQTLDTQLGTLSRKYEAKGVGDVSTGVGDPGGVSYGSYQLKSRPDGGRVMEFIDDPAFRWRDQLKGKPGTPAFTASWKALAAAEPEAFFAAQHGFIKKTHFDVLAKKIKSEDKLDVTQRSRALQDVIWSTAVHHGPGTPVVRRAIGKLGGTQTLTDPQRDRALISAIYAERGKRNKQGKLAYFTSSSDNVQQSVAKRFVNEERDALAMFDRGA